MTGAPTFSRRELFTGRRNLQSHYHVSSAVVSVIPGQMSSVMQAISSMPGVEVNAHDNHRIVIVMEATSTGELGERLTAIGALGGVIAANMVFEQIEEREGSEPWQQN